MEVAKLIIVVKKSHLFKFSNLLQKSNQAIPGSEKACLKFTTFPGFPDDEH